MRSDKQFSHFAFDHGNLLIATECSKIQIHGWPNPDATEQEGLHEPQPTRPAFRLVMRQGENRPGTPADKFISPLACDFKEGDPAAQKEKASAYAAFRESLPPDLAIALERFQSYQWNLIDLAWKKREFLDLLKSNPVLAYFLANNDHFRKLTAKTPACQAQWHVQKKQRQLLDWLGFPPNEATTRLMKKIVPESISPVDGRLLRHALKTDPWAVKLLAHQTVVNAGIIRIVVSAGMRCATPQLLAEVGSLSDEIYYPRTADLLGDAVNTFEQLHTAAAPPILRTTQKVREWHDRLEEKLRIKQQREKETNARKGRRGDAFPPPPISGSGGIIALTDKSQLMAEGRSQHNCVGAYVKAVQSGRCYIYRVLGTGPIQRATLSIRMSSGGEWYIDQLKQAHNADVNDKTLAAVHRWLTRNA